MQCGDENRETDSDQRAKNQRKTQNKIDASINERSPSVHTHDRRTEYAYIYRFDCFDGGINFRCAFPSSHRDILSNSFAFTMLELVCYYFSLYLIGSARGLSLALLLSMIPLHSDCDVSIFASSLSVHHHKLRFIDALHHR